MGYRTVPVSEREFFWTLFRKWLTPHPISLFRNSSILACLQPHAFIAKSRTSAKTATWARSIDLIYFCRRYEEIFGLSCVLLLPWNERDDSFEINDLHRKSEFNDKRSRRRSTRQFQRRESVYDNEHILSIAFWQDQGHISEHKYCSGYTVSFNVGF